tara:strand:+ start:75 stop:299 length:225 start_codon:yes stop_codon:yes gene_type:complete
LGVVEELVLPTIITPIMDIMEVEVVLVDFGQVGMMRVLAEELLLKIVFSYPQMHIQLLWVMEEKKLILLHLQLL